MPQTHRTESKNGQQQRDTEDETQRGCGIEIFLSG
jgi:hypothetical protein